MYTKLLMLGSICQDILSAIALIYLIIFIHKITKVISKVNSNITKE